MNKTGHIQFTTEGPVGIVTLNNPPENFLLEPEFLQIDELSSFIEKKFIKGLVFTGAGRHFSSGADLNKLFSYAKDEKLLQSKIKKGNLVLRYIEELEIPVIAAIDGVCFGGGLEIALACHIRICSDKALFAFPEVNHNLMPGLGGIQRITNLLKGGFSYEMILGGDMLSSKKAHDLNIVDHIVSKGKSLEYSIQLLTSMVKDKPLEVIQAITRTINFCRNKTIDDTVLEVTRIFCNLAVRESKRRKSDQT